MLGFSPGPTHTKGAATQNERIAMSKVSEMVDAEAAKAEAEPDEDEAAESEEVEGQEGDQEAPVEPALPHDPTEADMKAFQSEHARHEKALVKIMGDDFGMLVPCDSCGTMGYKPPDQLKTHKKYIACETCNGYGQVLTGSKAAGNETQPCPVCAGRGFLEEMPPAPAGPPNANGEQQRELTYGTPTWMGNPDMTPQQGYTAPVT